MRNTILILILGFGLLSFNKIKDSNEKLTEAELKFVKENYNWNSESLLIVNFRQPVTSCHYDNYTNLKKTSESIAKFYSKMELGNVRNIFVYSDGEKAKKIIDSKNHYNDIKSMFLNEFFSKDKTCYGILVFNRNGDFQKKAGEYTPEIIEELIDNLK